MFKAVLAAAIVALAACVPSAEEGSQPEAPADVPAMAPEADSLVAPADTMARDTAGP